MQYPVPQFTDVEDKIIGSLTIKQFGIIFGAGIIVFLGYTAVKSIAVLIVLAIFIGLPAIIVAFAKPLGRPLYKTLPFMVKFMFGPKVLVFHKDSGFLTQRSKIKQMQTSQEQEKEQKAAEDPRDRLKEVNRLLQAQAAEEAELVKQVR